MSYREENLIGDLINARYNLTAARLERAEIVTALTGGGSDDLEGVVSDAWATRNTDDEQKSIYKLRLVVLYRVAHDCTPLQAEKAMLPFFLAHGSRRKQHAWMKDETSDIEFLRNFPFETFTLRWLTANKQRVEDFLFYLENIQLNPQDESGLIAADNWAEKPWLSDNPAMEES